jgi:hydroxymethylpyrimidine/phosphomethylpyrimidine kinase
MVKSSMTKLKNYKCVLTIAGSDSSGGAGIQADIKTISALGCYAASIVTALTAQNTQGVQAIYAIPEEFVMQQIHSVFNDIEVNAVKIGMLHDENMIATVAQALEKFKPASIILDPVMVSKNNCELLQPSSVSFLKERLFPLATLITPNLPEAEKLLGIKITTTTDMQSAAIALGQQFKTNVLIKGGHLNADQASDVFFAKEEGQCYWFHADRVETKHTHGTGCTLSAAVSSYIAKEYSLYDAIFNAKQYLTNAIRSGSGFRLGHGCGPVNHFYHVGNV